MIGELRHRIQFQEAALVDDGYGGQVETWSEFETVWARVEPLSTRERMFAQKLEGNVTHKIKIRYLEGITTAMRISFKGRIFKILGPPINLDERGRWLELQCEEGSGS